ncbi:MAG: hypothetical protein EOM24_31995 [Chloroflexia bacterium]|nr:hypothetical protein [Chloroflexia bacterium]
MGLNYCYVAFNVTSVSDAIIGMRALNIRGFSVTIPHKLEVMKYLDEIDDVAQRIGAVNTIVNSSGKLKGYNTDWQGLVRCIEGHTTLAGKRISLLGAGGAARVDRPAGHAPAAPAPVHPPAHPGPGLFPVSAGRPAGHPADQRHPEHARDVHLGDGLAVQRRPQAGGHFLVPGDDELPPGPGDGGVRAVGARHNPHLLPLCPREVPRDPGAAGAHQQLPGRIARRGDRHPGVRRSGAQ